MTEKRRKRFEQVPLQQIRALVEGEDRAKRGAAEKVVGKQEPYATPRGVPRTDADARPLWKN